MLGLPGLCALHCFYYRYDFNGEGFDHDDNRACCEPLF